MKWICIIALTCGWCCTVDANAFRLIVLRRTYGAKRSTLRSEWVIQLRLLWQFLSRQTRNRADRDSGRLALEIAARLQAGEAASVAWSIVPENGQTTQSLRDIQAFSTAVGAAPEFVLQHVAQGLTEAARAAAEREVALAGPRATARLFAALPLVIIVVTSAAGVPLLPTYLDLGIGSTAMLLGVLLYVLGIIWMRALHERAARFGTVGDGKAALDLAVIADLIAAGADIASVVGAIGRACHVSALRQTEVALLTGKTWDSAWSQSPPELVGLADVLQPAWIDGIAPGALLTHYATGVRTDRLRDAQTAARRMGVAVTLPLGLCMLPAFVLLVVVPLILHGIFGIETG